MFAVGATDTEPETAFAVAKLVPVHDVAFVEDHVSVEDWPEVMVVGLAVSVAVGAGVTVEDTLTLAVFETAPPNPVQFKV